MKVLVVILLLCVISCRSIQYVPVKNTETKTEYVDRFKTDSVHVRDSVFMMIKGDTVFRDRYKTIYKDRFTRDTIHVSERDTIREPYPVEIIKEKYKVPKSLWWLVILLAGLSIPSVIKILRKFKVIKI